MYDKPYNQAEQERAQAPVGISLGTTTSPCQDTVEGVLHRRLGESGREFQNLSDFQAQLNRVPGTAELLDIVQSAIDLHLINTSQLR